MGLSQVQVAAAKAAALLLTTIPAERLPLFPILESTVVALKAWAGPCACFTDHALFPKWSQAILAVLELLIGVSRELGVSKVASLKLSMVRGNNTSQDFSREFCPVNKRKPSRSRNTPNKLY